ncbi:MULTISPECIES: hypothetical protein [unclassified Bradyrhizobium]
MATFMEDLEQSYAKAEAALATSVRAVERASKKRLSALLALPPHERFDHLADRSLTSGDALALIRSLRVEAKPKLHNHVSSNKTEPLSRLSMRILTSPATVAILAMTAFYGSVVWFRTPRRVTVTQPVQVTVQYPDGSRVNGVMNPGKTWWRIRSYHDRAIVRIWMPMTRYQEFEVPASIVQSIEG